MLHGTKPWVFALPFLLACNSKAGEILGDVVDSVLINPTEGTYTIQIIENDGFNACAGDLFDGLETQATIELVDSGGTWLLTPSYQPSEEMRCAVDFNVCEATSTFEVDDASGNAVVLTQAMTFTFEPDVSEETDPDSLEGLHRFDLTAFLCSADEEEDCTDESEHLTCSGTTVLWADVPEPTDTTGS